MSAFESAPATAPQVEINAELITRSPDTAERALSNVLAQHSPSTGGGGGGPSSTPSSSTPPRAASTSSSSRRFSRLSMLHLRTPSSSSATDGDAVEQAPTTMPAQEDTSARLQAAFKANPNAGSIARRREGSQSYTGRRRLDLPELERVSVARLRHQSSTATLKSADAATTTTAAKEAALPSATSSHSSSSADPGSSTLSGGTTSASERTVTGPGALRQERRKRSAMLEQDVTRLRSESRLGAHSRQGNTSSPEYERERSFSRSSAFDQSANMSDASAVAAAAAAAAAAAEYDTSGTEGSGPVVGNRRRKKSSTSSTSKNAAAVARAAHAERSSLPPAPPMTEEQQHQYQPRHSLRRGSDGARHHSATISGRDPLHTRRAALPDGFRSINPDQREQQSQSRTDRRITNRHDDRKAWPATENDDLQSGVSGGLRQVYRSRRFASDAEIPANEVSSANDQRSRASIDGYGRTQVGERSVQSAASSVKQDEEGRFDDDMLYSPSEAARQRKISTSSSLSHRSSGAASDIHRSASRASLRRAMGRDVFDDAPPPLPGHSPLLERFPAERNTIRDRTAGVLSAARTGAPIEELRQRLDELTNPGRSTHTISRSSSRASRARSNVSSTPSNSQTATSNTSIRPSTEPRRGATGTHDRSLSEISPDLKQSGFATPASGGGTLRRGQAPSRLAATAAAGLHSNTTSDTNNGPRTPYNSNSVSRRSVSRLTNVTQSAPHRAPSRFAGANGSHLRVNSQPEAIPLHARNLHHSMDDLEKHVLGAAWSEDLANGDLDAAHMIAQLRQACESATEMNAGLRASIQSVLGYQIDAEIGNLPSDPAHLDAFAMMDQKLSLLLRQSDEQVRHLTEGLMMMVRLRIGHGGREDVPVVSTTSPSVVESPPAPRTSSRIMSSNRPVSTLLSSSKSPQQQESLATGSRSNSRRSSLDLRSRERLR